MKRIASVMLAVACLSGWAPSAAARVNLLDPWYPGQDCAIGPLNVFKPSVSLLRGERLIEVPATVTFAFHPRAEASARWGIKHFNDYTGINDLQIGVKYDALNAPASGARVTGEAGVSLPTGDSANNIGTGAVAFLLHWALQKDLRDATGQDITSFFGLGYIMNGENSDNLRLGNVFWYHIGAAYDYNRALRFYGELKGFNHAVNRINGTALDNSNYQELYLAPGVDVTFNNGRVVTGALLLGLTPESHDIGLFLTTRI